MDELDAIFQRWISAPLFKRHEAAEDVLRSVHRFRAVDRSGLLALGKDVARLTADRIDITTLRKIIASPKGETWGSLKFLQNVLGTVLSEEQARATVTPVATENYIRAGAHTLPRRKNQNPELSQDAARRLLGWAVGARTGGIVLAAAGYVALPVWTIVLPLGSALFIFDRRPIGTLSKDRTVASGRRYAHKRSATASR